MTNPHTWEKEIAIVLEKLGGEAFYEDIYQKIEDRNTMYLSKSWKDGVRGCMQRASSDTKSYANVRDLFYSVEGLGNGAWGLRSFREDIKSGNITEDDLGYPEGKRQLKKHVSRERNPKVIREAKKQFKANNNGEIYCEVCGFDFSEKYGELGEGFIEGHHIIPVSEMEEGAYTKVDDIVLVCSNCHKMLHRKRPWISKEELQTLLVED